MANRIPVKAIYSGTDVTSLGEYTSTDKIDGAYLADGTVTAAKLAADTATQAELDAVAAAALPLAGGTMTGDTAHADNAKAKFGTGNDLQIFHDSSHSFITESGTGNLRVGGDNLALQSSAHDENYVICLNGDSVTLYHNNAAKISTTATGVAVTGKVIADAGGFGTTAPLSQLQVGGSTAVSADSKLVFGKSTAASQGFLPVIQQSSTGGVSNDLVLAATSGDGAIRMYTGASSGSGIFGTTNNAERLRIDNSGDVGIGTASPLSKLDVSGGFLTLSSSATVGRIGASQYITGSGTDLIVQATGSGVTRFYQSGTHSMTIDHVGGLGLGTTTTNYSSQAGFVVNPASNGYAAVCHANGTATGTSYFVYAYNGGVIGSVSQNGTTGVAYNTASDYRLKTDVQPMTGATARVKLLKPCNFEWISDGTRVDGFLAHEAQEVIPEAVHGTKDAMRDEEYEVNPATGDMFTPSIDAYVDADENEVEAVAEVIHSTDVEQPETLQESQQWRETTAAVMGTRSVPDMQGIDQAKLVPLLTATIQELIARIEALEGAAP